MRIIYCNFTFDVLQYIQFPSKVKNEVKQMYEAKPHDKISEIHGDDFKYLRLKNSPDVGIPIKTIRAVDLFCGCGGFSLGMQEACNTLNLGFSVELAVDFDRQAANCFKQNFKGANVIVDDIGNILSFDLGTTATESENVLLNELPPINILIGGPPCQGHSDLNNFARRKDPKNRLYLYMARAAELLKPEHIIIENVAGAIHDKGKVVQTVAEFLSGLGYAVSVGTINLVNIGVPQNRRRLILAASKTRTVDVNSIEKKYFIDKRNLAWAIQDLEGGATSSSLLSTPSTPSKDNKNRMKYLFENNLYELPNEQRPPCHRDKTHSYNTIYGRLRWENPSQTITSGFYSMCMGRYVHPTEIRTLTAHEAARLQFFPDYFDFSTVENRTSLATIIGNALPMKLPYLIGLELLGERGA
jgi:DNA (cytosine-5)-methyltransferase 1